MSPSSPPQPPEIPSGSSAGNPELVRGIGLVQATTLNMIDMIGVGPFITIPLIIAAAGGPQAMLGWILGAIFALCDGLVWAELGAAMPNAGGSYEYLKQSYGPKSLGRLLSFLFIWQLSFSAPLSIASGCIGLSHYAGYLWPGLERTIAAHTFHLGLPLIGTLEARVLVMPATWVAIATCAVGGSASVSADQRCRQACRVALGRSCARRRMGNLRRTYTLQRRRAPSTFHPAHSRFRLASSWASARRC